MPTIVGPSKPYRMCVVPGGAIAVPLGPCGGIDTVDQIISVTQVDEPFTTATDLTSEASIPTADRVQLTTTDTTGDFLIVTWQENE